MGNGMFDALGALGWEMRRTAASALAARGPSWCRVPVQTVKPARSADTPAMREAGDRAQGGSICPEGGGGAGEGKAAGGGVDADSRALWRDLRDRASQHHPAPGWSRGHAFLSGH